MSNERGRGKTVHSEAGKVIVFAVCNFSYISVCKHPDDDLHIEPKHAAVNNLIKIGVLCDLISIVVM
jgi:hypothetical protein